MLAEMQRVPARASPIYKTTVYFYQKRGLKMRGREDAAKSGGIEIIDN
jgi:hypothetical protein